MVHKLKFDIVHWKSIPYSERIKTSWEVQETTHPFFNVVSHGYFSSYKSASKYLKSIKADKEVRKVK
jgi:hypothetical protein